VTVLQEHFSKLYPPLYSEADVKTYDARIAAGHARHSLSDGESGPEVPEIPKKRSFSLRPC
jgi:hypothetical protein